MFKKKTESYTKSNTELNKAQKNKYEPMNTYDTYSTSNGSSSPKKGYVEEVKM